MADPSLLVNIQRQIVERYGSLESPSFFFVDEQLKKKPYRALVSELAGRFTLLELTDPNEDVSFVYEITDGPNRLCRLELSMIGPYACVQWLFANDRGQQEFIDELLARFGISVLTKQILETSIPLKLHYTEPVDVCLYQALFADSSPPWGDC